MDRDAFLAATLRNPVNEAIADELFRLALPDAWIVSGCLVQTAWNVLTGRAVDYGINDYDVFYFDPDTSWQAEDVVIRKLQNRLAHLGVKIEARNQARVHLWYPEKHRPALPGAALFDRWHRPLPDQKYPGRNPPHPAWSRRLCAQRLRRYRRHDRAAQPGSKFLGGKLRGEGSALEKVVAGTHGACGRQRMMSPRPPYRTTPEINPALRRGGLMSFFRKQCGALTTYPGRAKVQARHLLSPTQAALQASSLSPLLRSKLR